MKTEESRQVLSVSSAQDSVPSPVTADDHVALELSRIWEEELGLDSISPDQNFFDLGGDSSLAVRMFSKIEDSFGVKLPLATLYEAPTVEQLAGILRAEVSVSRWSPLVAIQPKGSRPPLFCMHGAGGTVLMYRELSRHLGDDQPFYGLQAPGLDGSSAPLGTVEEMASLYEKEIRRKQAHGPYFIAGYCMGGTVAYEVAQQLVQRGETVALLALFDTMNWHKIPLNIWTKGSRTSEQFFFHAASFLSLDAKGKVKFFGEKFRELKNRIPVWRGMLLSQLNQGSNEKVSDSLILARIWQSNDRASWNYLAKPYAGRITDIRPAKQYRIFDTPDAKWEALAQGGVDVITLPVNPASMLVEPFVEHLAAAVRQAIDAAAQASVGSSRELEAKGV